MRIFSRVAAICSLLVLGACAGAAVPVGPTASAWCLGKVAVRFGPTISRTATGTDYDSNFVWNGYDGGNRKKQVVALFRNAVAGIGREAMTGPRKVDMRIVVTRFHALTDASRMWCCGEHNITADLEVVDAATGEVLASGRDVYLGRIALGGIPALVAEAAGRDQAVRVQEGIANGIRGWLAGI